MQNTPNLPSPTPGLLAPGQLWAKKPVVPAPTQPAPALPAPPQPAPLTLGSPDQLRQQMQNGAAKPPVAPLPIFQPPSTDFKGQLGQIQSLMQKADQQALAPYGVVVQSNAQGQISGYLLNGRPATAEQVQQHLLPLSSRLHKELQQTKTMVDQEYSQFITRSQTQLAQMTPVEQNAVKIQLQAVQSIYQGFVNRLNQVDNLIK
ncbi:MAG: hypothetical protein IV090_13675 [Candidatus Sericytochromatia bacterium]|nr:hypothetical protein [Candidatus Sericytochromatia bacterium]